MIRGGRAKGFVLSLSLLLLAAGCGVEVTSSRGLGLADLEVSWTIEGSTSPLYCFDFAIDGWLVEVQGPEVLEIFVDCRDEWTTFSALYGLFEGFYDVYVTAIDPGGFDITTLSSSIDLFDFGFVEYLDFQFWEVDFF